MALIGITLIAHNPAALALFYQTALGFSIIGGTATSIRLRYGPSEITIIAADPPGQKFPAAQMANSLSFQHFALITADIFAAHKTLAAIPAWRAISKAGPVKLPASSGGVTAFKFRDPEGHPLELLQPATPAEPCIDHTAIVVKDTAASMAFYNALGLVKKSATLNHGPEQAALDGLKNPIAVVTRLGSESARLALELLCYQSPAAPAASPPGVNDVAATRLIFAGAAAPATDPDGHHIAFKDLP